MIPKGRNALNKIPLPLLLLILASTRLSAQPIITSQPTNQTVATGGNAMFSVVATGVGPLTYQWLFNGTNLPNNIITTIAGGGSGIFSNNVPATNAVLGNVYQMAMDVSGNLFFADYDYHLIRQVTTNGIVKTVAGNGSSSYPGDGAVATNAGFGTLYGLAVDSFGNLFFTDTGPNRATVRKVDPNGIVTTAAGKSFGVGTSGDGGPSTNAALSNPRGLAVDSGGNLYIANSDRVRRVDTNGIITRVAGGGVDTSDGIQATNANITLGDVKLDFAGNMYISGGAVIRKIDTNGIITTLAGTFAHYGSSGDGGAATNALLTFPAGMTLDPTGKMFIADFAIHRIRQIDTNGVIITVVGNGSSGFSGDGGAATNAILNTPYSVILDSVGNLFIADQHNYRIRKVAYGGMPTRTLNNIGKQNAGNYQVIVSGSSGSVTSSVAMLFLPPQIQANAASLGVQSSLFGFNVTGISNQVVVIEASTNLAASSWVALQTNILDTNVFYFSDPTWTNFSGRFYRARTP